MKDGDKPKKKKMKKVKKDKDGKEKGKLPVASVLFLLS